ncbi:hypothetical protein JOL62DRAFT_547268 [Phyllosticta paracitricarpa]|uniref:Uncharacterized protein n=1 Tax=Phyllosticta paracitricarpa TaxID=2016321 RepID=A0ABR1N3E3_9PEZI
MFGPHFNEGRNLSCENPKEIPLPDDNPMAIKLLCAILHHRYRPDETPPFELVKRLAEAIDKYLCVPSTKAITTMWLHKILVTPWEWEFPRLVELLAASYLLKSDSAFHETSKALVLKYNTTLTLDFHHAMTQLPWQCIVAIAELKNMFESEIYSKFSSKLSAFINENRRKMSRNCEEVPIRNCNQHITGFLGSPRLNIIPPRGANLEEHLKYLCGSRTNGEDGSMNETAYEGLFSTDRSAQQMCGGCRFALLDVFEKETEDLEKELRSVIKQMSGLCLGCVVESNKLLPACCNGSHCRPSKQ